jgi:hypothetical protein
MREGPPRAGLPPSRRGRMSSNGPLAGNARRCPPATPRQVRCSAPSPAYPRERGLPTGRREAPVAKAAPHMPEAKSRARQASLSVRRQQAAARSSPSDRPRPRHDRCGWGPNSRLSATPYESARALWGNVVPIGGGSTQWRPARGLPSVPNRLLKAFRITRRRRVTRRRMARDPSRLVAD